MGLQLISISHKTAPVQIREKFAFPVSVQKDILQRLTSCECIQECVLISTCNRTEVYTWSEEDGCSREVFELVQHELSVHAGLDGQTDHANIFRFYYKDKVIRHLFLVASGLDSMVMGEDQILGQVKDAHRLALEQHTSGTYLNTFFRYAVTAAKKVKTDTRLSTTPISTAVICIRAAKEYLQDLDGKNILVIGAGGKIGSIICKDLQSDYRANLFVTVRETAQQSSDMPGQFSVGVGQSSAEPEQPSAEPEQPSAGQEQSAAMPEQSAAMPGQSTGMPGQSTEMPQQPSAEPEQPCKMPAQPTGMPGPSCVGVDQSSAEPEQPSAEPEQPSAGQKQSSKIPQPSSVGARQPSGCRGARVPVKAIPYEKRYDYLEQMDAVISATASPHYTLTYESVRTHLTGPVRPRAFIDLAVPMDIEGRIGTLPGVMLCNIDDIGRISQLNQEIRRQEASDAMEILEGYEEEFKKWMIFQTALGTLRDCEERILQEMETTDAKKALDHFFYGIRETVDAAQLEVFMDCLKKLEE